MGNTSSATKDKRTPSPDDIASNLPTLNNAATSSNSIPVKSRQMLQRPIHCRRSSRLSSIISGSPVLSLSDHQSSLSTLNTPTTSVMSESILATKKTKCYTPKRRKSSLLLVRNGITGQFISSRIAKIAAKFWRKHIETLSATQQLEVGCSIFFSMISANNEMKNILQFKIATKQIEKMSLKYLDMMGWIIRYLITDNIDLHTILVRLGVMHQSMGIKIDHFNPMLQALHETFSYYFESAYNIEVKYSFDEIFSLAAQIMTGQDLKCNSHLAHITEQFQGTDIPFLKDLNICLKNKVGSEYLYRFLSQTWCDEIVIFLKALSRFKNAMSYKQRFMIGREITKININQTAVFCLNLSHETRENILNEMNVFKEKFLVKEEFEIGADFFAEVEQEVYKLIMDNHWKKFRNSIEILQLQSYDNLISVL